MNNQGDQAPDRWIGCPPYGEVIDDTFLPMKTLLNDDVALPEQFKFTPKGFLEQMRDIKINVGLIINLTKTARYYDGDELSDSHGVEYRHIPCQGFEEAPQPREREQFVKVVNSYLSRNPRKIVAVHCTHGFNRTGFMICSYLCSERDWSIDAAVAHFAAKRPPGIYKKDYIKDLFDLFGDADDPLPDVPPQPNWQSEEAMILMQDAMNLTGGIRPNAIETKEFYEGITDVSLVRDEALKYRIYRHCCLLCNYKTNSSHITFPGAQPVSMDVQNVHLIKTKPYLVSWKADGNRYMLYIQDEDNIFFLTRSLQLWRVVGLKFPKLEDLQSHLTDTLVDGEMVTDTINGNKVPKFLIYDVISLNGTIVANQNFNKRCGIIKSVIVEARTKAKFKNIINSSEEPFKVGDKGFFYLQDTRKTLNLKVPHEKDGLIFQPIDDPYTGGTCPSILKWKPPHMNSIDFRIVVREERRNGCLPESVGCLHVSNSPNPVVVVQNLRRDDEYHNYNGKIVEMTLDPKTNRWKVMRERTDKLTPNSYETAMATFKSIKQPITEEYLLDLIAKIPKIRPQ